jgi:hypothetical protein
MRQGRPALGDSYRPGTKVSWLGDDPTYGADPRVSRVAYLGAPQTVRLMAKSALEDCNHFETRKLCEAYCERIDSKDYTSEYLALYYLILQRTRYMRDPKRVELVRAPWVVSGMILDGHVPNIDCDDSATMLTAGVMAMGGQVSIITVAFSDMFYEGQRQYSHVLIGAKEPRSGAKIILDPVAAENTASMLRRVKAAKVYPITA